MGGGKYQICGIYPLLPTWGNIIRYLFSRSFQMILKYFLEEEGMKLSLIANLDIRNIKIA
jgi:hypothetical protein